MPNAAIPIVQEFLVSSDSRLRKNASVALAAIGGGEALRLLVDLAVGDEDDSVRNKAVNEIEQLSDENAAAVKQLVLADLNSSNGSARHYALASALVNSGKARFNELPFWRGCRYAWLATNPELGRRRTRDVWFTILCFAVGLLVGWAALNMLASFLNAKLSSSTRDMDGVLLEALAGLAGGVLLGWRRPCWKGQARSDCAALIELCMLAVVGAVTIGVITVILAWTWTGPIDSNAMIALVKSYVVCGVAALVSRLFVLAVLRKLPLAKILWPLCSLLAIWAGLAFLLGFAMSRLYLFTDQLFGLTFIQFVPLLFSLGLVFAYRDKDYSAKRFVFGGVTAGLCIFFALSAAAAGLFCKLHPGPPPALRKQSEFGADYSLDIYENQPVNIRLDSDYTCVQARTNTVIDVTISGSQQSSRFSTPVAQPPSVSNGETFTGKNGQVITVSIDRPDDKTLLPRLSQILGRKEPIGSPIEVTLNFQKCSP